MDVFFSSFVSWRVDTNYARILVVIFTIAYHSIQIWSI